MLASILHQAGEQLGGTMSLKEGTDGPLGGPDRARSEPGPREKINSSLLPVQRKSHTSCVKKVYSDFLLYIDHTNSAIRHSHAGFE